MTHLTYQSRCHDPVFRGPRSPRDTTIRTQAVGNEGEDGQHDDAARHIGRIVAGDGHACADQRSIKDVSRSTSKLGGPKAGDSGNGSV